MKVRANKSAIYQGFHREKGEVFDFDAESASMLAINSKALHHLEKVPDGVEPPVEFDEFAGELDLPPIDGRTKEGRAIKSKVQESAN